MWKLLLADDSVTIQRVINLTFTGEDVLVLSVGDGEEAIARIPIERPDIVLADIGMPRCNGYDVCAFVKGRSDLKHVPVLLLAGAFDPVDDDKARAVGCDGVLIKPFEPRHVIARVRDLIVGAKRAPPASHTSLADAFSALLAAEMGEQNTGPIHLGANGSAPVFTDGVIDSLARRIVERLSSAPPDQMRTLVTEIVSNVAERLVREELERSRQPAAGSAQ